MTRHVTSVLALSISLAALASTASAHITEQSELTPSDLNAGDHFGQSIALFDHTAAVGSPRHDDGAPDSGAVYVFLRTAFAWNQERIGTRETILIDGCEGDNGTSRLHGRSYGEAPEIDSCIYLDAGVGRPGEYHDVRIIAAEEYDLVAEPASLFE